MGNRGKPVTDKEAVTEPLAIEDVDPATADTTASAESADSDASASLAGSGDTRISAGLAGSGDTRISAGLTGSGDTR